jgi:AAA+ superfamily predicted ATPase
MAGAGESGGMSAGDFGAAFKGFLEQTAAQAPVEDPFFVGKLRELFGGDPFGFPVIGQEFPVRDHPNLQRAIDGFLEGPGRSAEFIGVSTAQKSFNGVMLSELVARGRRPGLIGDSSPTPGPVEYADVALGEDETLTCIKSGLMLIEDGAERLAVLVSSQASSLNRGQIRVEVMAPEREDAEKFLAEIRRGVRERNVYRGRVISLVQEPQQQISIRIHSLPDIKREDIILPAGVLERVERHTVVFSSQVDRLRAAGQHAKRGLLLHGPPGTGKTLTAKYVAGLMADRTVLLLTGASLRLIEPACTMARLLQPALVILEDVDLIAEERTHEHASLPVLFELLNQLDGMEEDADVVFFLTTNRPDLLEPALAARPGRVDLAVEVPLPDDSCRRRLFELYSRGLTLDVGDLDHFVTRTRGVSAAFIRELVRKAALSAADQDGPLVIREQHLDDALQELLFEGGELTRSLLGGHTT